MAVHLPQCVKEVIEQNLSLDPAELALLRCKELTKWTLKAEQLKQQEVEFKRNLPKHMQPLMQQKRLLLCKADKQLVTDMARGFSITGWQDKTGVFPQCVKRPQFSLGTLKQMANGLNRAILQQLRDDKDDEELVLNTWEKTLEEVELGYIWPDDTSDPMIFFLAKRFGLVQRAGKLRVIDDCSIWGINSTVGAVEKYRVHAMDECAAFLAYMVDFVERGHDVEGVSGRTYDLKHAYKQYWISEADRDVIRLAVRNPRTKGLRGVLVDPNGKVVSFFGGEVPDPVMRLLLERSKNPIYELEVLPVLVAAWMWGERVARAQVCWYLDNEASRSASIKAQGATVIAGTMVGAFANEEMRLQIKSWFARVPSLSNFADSPSRLEDQLLLSLGAVKGPIDWQAVANILG
eukprot:s3503_g9.t1